jgi:hypothetical protein
VPFWFSTFIKLHSRYNPCGSRAGRS